MADELVAMGGGCIALLVALFVGGFTSIAPTEMALEYNWFTKMIDPVPIVEPGFRWIGPYRYLYRYPKTITTIEYEQSHRDILDGRTSDGLPLLMGITFQYQLKPEELFQLYDTYEGEYQDYVHMFELMGIHLLTEFATNFTAYQFFNEKQTIAEHMRQQMDIYFQANMFASVTSLQINEDSLPQPFTEKVLQAATERQNITRMTKYRDSQVVNFQTARIVAYAQANVTVNNAQGNVHRIAQDGRADAAIIDAYVEAEKQAYLEIRDGLHIQGDALIDYMWYDSLSGGAVSNTGQEVDTSVLVGISPSAYIDSVPPATQSSN